MKKTDLAYAAGMVDGEGCIQILRKRKGGRYFEMRVAVDNTSEWVCMWLKIHFGGSVCSYTNNYKHPSWKWMIGTKDAMRFLKLISPYLQIKQAQAKLAIQFQETRSPNPGRGGRTDGELAVLEAQYILLKDMHHPFRIK